MIWLWLALCCLAASLPVHSARSCCLLALRL